MFVCTNISNSVTYTYDFLNFTYFKALGPYILLLQIWIAFSHLMQSILSLYFILYDIVFKKSLFVLDVCTLIYTKIKSQMQFYMHFFWKIPFINCSNQSGSSQRNGYVITIPKNFKCQEPSVALFYLKGWMTGVRCNYWTLWRALMMMKREPASTHGHASSTV